MLCQICSLQTELYFKNISLNYKICNMTRFFKSEMHKIETITINYFLQLQYQIVILNHQGLDTRSHFQCYYSILFTSTAYSVS